MQILLKLFASLGLMLVYSEFKACTNVWDGVCSGRMSAGISILNSYARNRLALLLSLKCVFFSAFSIK